MSKQKDCDPLEDFIDSWFNKHPIYTVDKLVRAIRRFIAKERKSDA